MTSPSRSINTLLKLVSRRFQQSSDLCAALTRRSCLMSVASPDVLLFGCRTTHGAPDCTVLLRYWGPDPPKSNRSLMCSWVKPSPAPDFALHNLFIESHCCRHRSTHLAMEGRQLLLRQGAGRIHFAGPPWNGNTVHLIHMARAHSQLVLHTTFASSVQQVRPH